MKEILSFEAFQQDFRARWPIEPSYSLSIARTYIASQLKEGALDEETRTARCMQMIDLMMKADLSIFEEDERRLFVNERAAVIEDFIIRNQAPQVWFKALNALLQDVNTPPLRAEYSIAEKAISDVSNLIYWVSNNRVQELCLLAAKFLESQFADSRKLEVRAAIQLIIQHAGERMTDLNLSNSATQDTSEELLALMREKGLTALAGMDHPASLLGIGCSAHAQGLVVEALNALFNKRAEMVEAGQNDFSDIDERIGMSFMSLIEGDRLKGEVNAHDLKRLQPLFDQAVAINLPIGKIVDASVMMEQAVIAQRLAAQLSELVEAQLAELRQEKPPAP